ncbi:uncharacterized protein LOC117918886 isoform X1 [Vitis riparia]|uniref:uncharacterized protein LOC117918886 isoform X1 n=1 Tax=Vitis riparia TaxID=96939 RepID=UPI00155B3303|nr:uncharacterized protein LOC117918886 isoform X1 [Vitis riparia]
MRGDEARLLLGFPPTSRLTSSQIKAAYKSKAWEYHPDRVPVQEKPGAESKFKLCICCRFQKPTIFCWMVFEEEIYARFILNGERSRRFTIVKGFPACQTDTQIVQLSCMVALTWDKLHRASENCHSYTESDMLIWVVMLESLSADWIVETEKQAMQEDVEILYNEMEQFYGDENDQYENESKCRDKRETRET